VRPNLGLVARLVKTVDRTPKLFQAVKILAERDEYPSAMALYAKILWKQGEDDQAMRLLEKLIHRLYPTMVPPLGQDDLTIGGALEPPWELYAAIIEQNGQHEKTNTILKTAALTFEDPGSLLNYAHIERVKGNMDVYERCMVKAAASGHQEAFRKLANFYLLVSLGRQTTHEQKRIGSILLRLIGQGRSLQTYRKMAIDWYELGFARECGRSTIILAALLREDGDLERANLCLTKAEEDEKFPKVVQKMRQKWDNDNFRFPFPDPWMDID
jgi:tetratricopeptide (TPR) repeat protein